MPLKPFFYRDTREVPESWCDSPRRFGRGHCPAHLFTTRCSWCAVITPDPRSLLPASSMVAVMAHRSHAVAVGTFQMSPVLVALQGFLSHFEYSPPDDLAPVLTSFPPVSPPTPLCPPPGRPAGSPHWNLQPPVPGTLFPPNSTCLPVPSFL